MGNIVITTIDVPYYEIVSVKVDGTAIFPYRSDQQLDLLEISVRMRLGGKDDVLTNIYIDNCLYISPLVYAKKSNLYLSLLVKKAFITRCLDIFEEICLTFIKKEMLSKGMCGIDFGHINMSALNCV